MDLIEANVSALATALGQQPDVITKFLTDANAAADVKPFADSLGNLKVFSTTDFDTRIANERQLAATEAANTTKGTTYGAVDRRVKESTGIEKNAGESTLEYQERAYREKFSKTTDSDETARLRGDLQAAQQLLATKNTEFDTYKADIAKKEAKQQVATAFGQAIAKVELADPGQADYVAFKFNEKYSSKPTEAGIEYADKATGQVVRNPNTAGLATAADILKTFVPTIPGVTLKKTSATGPSGYEAGLITTTGGKPSMDYAALTSREDFNKALAKRGIAAGSAEGTELYKAAKEARPELFT